MHKLQPNSVCYSNDSNILQWTLFNLGYGTHRFHSMWMLTCTAEPHMTSWMWPEGTSEHLPELTRRAGMLCQVLRVRKPPEGVSGLHQTRCLWGPFWSTRRPVRHLPVPQEHSNMHFQFFRPDHSADLIIRGNRYPGMDPAWIARAHYIA